MEMTAYCWAKSKNFVCNISVIAVCMTVNLHENLTVYFCEIWPKKKYILVIDINHTKKAKSLTLPKTSAGGSNPLPHCPSSQELRFTAGQPPLSLHQGEETTLIRDGVPPTKPYHIDPCHHPGPLMEVLGMQTPPPLRHGRQVALYSSLEAAGLAALLFSPWDWFFGNIAGRCVQMSTF